MKEIVNRLHENRQIELAKSILEANGYKVTMKESSSPEVVSRVYDLTNYCYEKGITIGEDALRTICLQLNKEGFSFSRSKVEDLMWNFFDEIAGDEEEDFGLHPRRDFRN